MEKLWSAANVKIYGGGVDDDKFLRRISDLIGPYGQIVTSESSGRGPRQRSRSVQEKTILTVAELREHPSGRAICFASGTPAGLIEPQPWFLGKDAAVIEASSTKHGSSSSADLSAAARSHSGIRICHARDHELVSTNGSVPSRMRF